MILGGVKLSRMRMIVSYQVTMNKPLIHRGHENNILVEKNVVVAKIVINIVLFLVCIIGFIGVSYGEFNFSHIVLLTNLL